VIEITDREDIQMFKSFHSTQLKVHYNEKFGELRVFDKVTMKALSRVYVKVFCKTR